MKQRIIFEIIQDFFVSTVLTLVAALVSGAGISFVPFVLDVLFAWLVNLIIGFAVPEKRIGEFLAQKLKLNKTLSFLFVLLVIVVINVVGISACVVFKNVGFNPMFFQIWGSLLPWLLLAGYIAALVFYPLTDLITKALTKSDKM